MNSYQAIKNHIEQNLRKKQESLNSKDIANEVDNAKEALDKVGVKLFALIIGVPELQETSDTEWKRIARELEESFNVKMDHGLLIQGEKQQQRDSTWWTATAKQETESYYWDRYQKFLARESLPPEVVRTIDVDTDIVMNNIENPNTPKFDRRGMVVGHVQSGKTGNYSALICKATDAGYKFIVVIAGGINNLRNQTQERINESFIGKDGGVQVGVGRGDAQPKKLPISLTTKEADFNRQDANRNSQSLTFENTTTPLVVVIKKNTHTLTNVISWLKRQYPNKIDQPMLMIDDESDYASINTSEEENPTTINRKLRELLELFNKSVYVAYTATPYANIFIDHEAGHDDVGNDLFPKDFIYALDAPSNYFGARKVFLDTDHKHLVAIDDYLEDIPPKHKKDFELPTIPNSLYEAMRVFVLNIAIRNLRGQGGQHNSMLIHATRFTAVHQKLAFHVEGYISKIKREISAYGKLPKAEKQSILIESIKDTFNSKHNESEFSWNLVVHSLSDVIESVVIREVHQSTSIPLEYRKNSVTNAIVVGGTSLSRGYTLEGLNVSYFLRNTVFYDTLMQMGRWFGYRPNYQDLCKIYMPETIIDNFGYIIETTEDLIKDFKIMADAKKTPNDFGLAIKQHPNSLLQITARNKQKNVTNFTYSMRLDGQSKETSWLSNNSGDKKDNIDAIENIIKELQHNHQAEKINNNYLWREVNKVLVVGFLNQFKVYKKDALGISSRMPTSFIKQYVDTRDKKWDIAIYSGTGESDNISGIKFNREVRQSNISDGRIEIKQRQVSTGTAEAIALEEKYRHELKSKRKKIRQKLTNPLLMLHIIETDYDKRLAAFGVSFPGDVLSKEQTINLKVNTVYYQNLLEDDRTNFDD